MKMIDLVNGAWAITAEMLDEIQAIYARHLSGPKLDQKEIIAAIGRPAKNERRYLNIMENGVAVISLEGVLGKKMNLFMDISGGTSTQLATAEFKAALEDPDVKSILLDIDSPGGAVDGTADMAQAIRAARGQKPIMAFTDGLIASAAYWIASAADKIFISNETAMVGSIGVIGRHVDYSKRDEADGIKKTEITAGKYKSPYPESEPLSGFGREVLQGTVDHIYGSFVDDVAANRGLETADHEAWADGRVFLGAQAVESGLVDAILSRKELIDNMAAGDAVDEGSVMAGSEIDSGQAVEVKNGMAYAIAAKPENENPAAGDATGTEEGKVEVMTIAELKASHPDLVKDLQAEGIAVISQADFSAARPEMVEAFTKEGASAEAARVADVRAESLPGHEALVEDMAADGSTTGPQAAQRILAAQRDILKDKGAQVSQDAADLIAASEPSKDDDTGLTAEQKMDKAWEAMSPEDQGAAGGKEAWTAYQKKGSTARVLGKK